MLYYVSMDSFIEIALDRKLCTLDTVNITHENWSNVDLESSIMSGFKSVYVTILLKHLKSL